MTCLKARTINELTSWISLPAAFLEMWRLSPIKRWLAPVARNLRQSKRDRIGESAMFLFVSRSKPSRISSWRWMIVGLLNRYLSKSSSSEYPRGSNRSLCVAHQILCSKVYILSHWLYAHFYVHGHPEHQPLISGLGSCKLHRNCYLHCFFSNRASLQPVIFAGLPLMRDAH